MENKDKELHRVTSTAIIYKQTDAGFVYLITKRSPTKKVYPGKWTVPGGGLSTDDYTPLAPTHGDAWYNVIDLSLRREIQEEVSIEVGKLEYLLDLTFIRPDGIPVITLSYYAPYVSGEVTFGDDDCVEFAWVTAQDARNYDLIDGIPQEIEMVEERLRNT
jgi:8-oxo-dGTP pyrophosphatase MutT (NUDIX family)